MDDNSKNHGIRRTIRDSPPAHFLLQVESFSLLAQTGVDKYESEIFETAGHKWRLSLYPNGDTNRNGSFFISLYLTIEETKNLPQPCEVNVSFKLFVLDQIRDKYLTIEDADGAVKRFHRLKTEWGFAQLLSLDTFNDTSNGYLMNDACVFGAEVFLMQRNYKLECLSMIKEPQNNTLTFKIVKLSKSLNDFHESAIQTIGDSKWKLKVYPKCKGKALGVYVELVDAFKLPPKKKIFAEFKLRVRDQINENHNEKIVRLWFGATTNSWGYSQFMVLKDLHEECNGYVVNDSMIIEAEITIISKSEVFYN